MDERCSILPLLTQKRVNDPVERRKRQKGCGEMTSEEMIDLLCEYGGKMQVSRAMTTEEEQYGCKYVLSLNGIICGSDLVDPWFVRDYIKRHIK